MKELAKAEGQVNEKLKRLAAESNSVAKRSSRDDAERKKIMMQIRGDKLERQVCHSSMLNLSQLLIIKINFDITALLTPHRSHSKVWLLNL